MRTTTAALAAVALTIGLAAPAAAHPMQDIRPPLTVDLTHAATDNVGFEARFHEHFGAAGGILTSNEWNGGQEFFVVTDPRGVFTYDVSEPASPARLGFTLVSQALGADGVVKPLPATQAALAQEDPSTDGRIVLVDGTATDGSMGMQVVDISDPTAPAVIGTLSGTTDHTWTCVSDQDGNGCAYAYGRSDQIVDLTDPTSPALVDEGWKTQIGDGNYTHDLTEIRPGLVMSAGAKPVLLDTTDPANPIELARVDENDHRPFHQIRNFSSLGYHSVEWAQAGDDDFLIMGTEIAPGNSNAGTDCNGPDSVIETWDARPVRAALAEYDTLISEHGMTRLEAADAVFGSDRDAVNFRLLDQYMAAGEGIFLDGAAPGHVLYCAHWMEPERGFADGGRLVAGYYNRGARFIDVAPFGTVDEDGNDLGGQMTEVGWFVGADAYTGSAQWVTDEVVYVMDYARGMDVIRITDQEATGTYQATGSVSDRAMTIAEMEGLGIAPPPAEDGGPHGMLIVAGLALAAGAALRRRHPTTAAA